MFRILLIILAIIILYKLIFGFIIPVYRTSRDIRKRFRDMHQQMDDNSNQFDQTHSQRPRPAKKQASDKDYIDFEEVK